MYNMANKVTQCKSSSLPRSSVCSIILWTHFDDAISDSYAYLVLSNFPHVYCTQLDVCTPTMNQLLIVHSVQINLILKFKDLNY